MTKDDFKTALRAIFDMATMATVSNQREFSERLNALLEKRAHYGVDDQLAQGLIVAESARQKQLTEDALVKVTQ